MLVEVEVELQIFFKKSIKIKDPNVNPPGTSNFIM
jgi:hypothetical protein